MLFWSLWYGSDLSAVVLIPLMLCWSVWCCSDPSSYCSDLSDVVLIPLHIVLICLTLFWSLWCCSDLSDVVLICLMLFWSLWCWYCSDPSDIVLISLMLFWSLWCFSDPSVVVLNPDPSDVVMICLILFWSLLCFLIALFCSLCCCSDHFASVRIHFLLFLNWSLFICADHSVIGVPPRASHPPAVCRGFSSYAVNFFTVTYLSFFSCVRTPKPSLFTKQTTSWKTSRLFIISVFRKVLPVHQEPEMFIPGFCLFVLSFCTSIYFPVLRWHMRIDKISILVGSQLGHKTPKYLLYSCIYRKVKLLRRTLGKISFIVRAFFII